MEEYRVKPAHNRWSVVDGEGYPALSRQLYHEGSAHQIASLLNRDLTMEFNEGQALLDRLRREDHS